MALALADNLYTSVDIIVEEDSEALLALPALSALKPGAKVVLRKKLGELKVSTQVIIISYALVKIRPRV